MAVIPTTPPNITISPATSITAVSAILTANQLDQGIVLIGGTNYPDTVTEHGFLWSTTNTVPTLGDNKIIVSGTANGALSATFNQIISSTTYYVVAYAITSNGQTGYSPAISFTYTLPIDTIQKSYLYLIFRQGIYLGLLPNVISDFGYSQDINTAGVQVQVICAVTADTSALDITTIDDETGTPIQAEDGTNLTTERFPDIVGNNNSGALFRNGNQLIIIETSNYHPNGVQVFSGDIEAWSAEFGGTTGDQITIKAYSDGADLNNFIITGGDTLDQSQTSQNNSYAIFNQTGSGWVRLGQTFTVGAGITNLDAISIYSSGGGNVTLKITTNGGISSSVTQYLPSTPGVATEYKFTFAPIMPVTAGIIYTYTLQSDNIYPASVSIYYSSSNLYSGGIMLESVYGGGGGGGYNPYGSGTSDLQFKTWTGGNATTITYSSIDPTAMFKDTIIRYNSKGGSIMPAPGTGFASTGLSLTYTFKVATVLEGIQVYLSMAPYDWYWYVDVGTDIIYFKQASKIAKYTFVKGKHISGLNVTASTENIKNILYFTGGIPSGTTNLFSVYSDTTSIINNKQRLDRKSDNRVTIQGTADAISTSSITATKDETYQTSVTILDTTMDISLIKVGDTVGFGGFGTFVDYLVLQVVRVDYTPDQATLTLGQLPPRANQTLKDLEAQVVQLYTLANPTTPS